MFDVTSLTRREVLAAAGAEVLRDKVSVPKRPLIERVIPKTGEKLPAIGMGTARTFDTSPTGALEPLAEVLKLFLDGGAKVIDSSPMYGHAEEVTGALLTQTKNVGKPFLATKVWTTGKDEGIRQMNESFRKLATKRIDLMQVHNLQDTQTHLKTLRAWKEEGRIRYIGITHYQTSAFGELEKLLKEETLDFIQLPYSVGMREAESRLLPAAKDRGVAVLVMRPFEGGDLFGKARERALPSWAKDIDCSSWAQVFLKWVLGHPAVTCPIPATRKPEHMADNLLAGLGRLPDAALRKRIVQELTGG